MPETPPQRRTNTLLMIIVLFLAGAALKLAAPVVIALLLTILLVYLIDPVVVLLHRKLRLPLILSVVISVVFFAAIFGGLGVLIFIDLPHFTRTFPRFQEEIIARAQGMLETLEKRLGVNLVFDPFEELRSFPLRPLLMNIGRSSFRVLSEFTVIFFLAIILLVGKYRVIRTILNVFPLRRSLVPHLLKHIDRHMRAYLGIKALASLVIGIGTALILLAFRVEFAVTWGFLTILLNFIPVLGPITAVSLPTLISIIQYPGFLMPLSIIASLTVLHITITSFVEPRLLGERLDLSFFVIFIALFFWGWMWGPAGVILGVPVTATLKIILERIPATAHVAMLLTKIRRRRMRRPPPGLEEKG
jgi:predicted PurR-regulated permease PerM